MHKKYLAMLAGMKKKRPRKKNAEPWFTYVLECGDGSFYTGITNDVEKRLQKHSGGKGAAYTRTHLPVRLVYRETCRDRSRALIREAEIKALHRKQKEKLIAGTLPPPRRRKRSR